MSRQRKGCLEMKSRAPSRNGTVITPSLDALGLHTDRMGAGTLQREVWSGFSRLEQIGPDLHTIDEDMSDQSGQ